MLAGHNGTIAWATAALGADVSDFFYEQVTGDSAVRDGALVPLQLSAETIKVRGGSDIPMTVRRTTHGPILSDAMPSVDEAGRRAVVNGVAERQRYAVSLAWTGFTPSRTADAIFGISTAGSFAEFRAAATGYAVPALSLVYADVVPVEGTSVADIDEKAFDAYFSRRYGQLPDLLLPQTLQNIGLGDGQELNLAGLLLFGKRPQRYRPAFMVKAVAFPGTVLHDTRYLDSEDIDGTLLLSASAGRHAIQAAFAEEFADLSFFESVRFDGKTDPQIVGELYAAAGAPERATPGLSLIHI